ncbi:antiporter inner membrane protein [Candidatus Methanoplasma termitum]|uniref:Iron-sulfur cluster carrier protein n=1 Tax=Candidatus Methanoplasma termitum TaxID=1577791 RepID=A0A0A7LCU3_9ARCH|nr:Mrp/NBP35 family ATP-binding protein [Candidatus Methanoplasma termitum]AIZ56082.1 antiporter inner membrane protein [Candidatus Methanoplasma termitum]MCL2333788.1 Mrp/NBP35 family ATP-binding protein [Candidatus Methanoplasma sp.]
MPKPMMSGEDIENETKLHDSLSRIKHVIIVMSGKGGVGKSTVSSNLAQALSMKGYQTGLMDVDITGPNIPKMFHIEDEKLYANEKNMLIPISVPPSLSIMSMAFLLPSKDSAIMWRGPMKSSAIRQFIEDVDWGDLDYLIIDMPPGTGDEAMSIAQLIPKADGAVIVTTPQDVAVLDSRKSITFAAETNIPIIGIVENMSGFICPHCGKLTEIFGSGGGEKAAESLDIQFLGRIPMEPGVARSGDSGMPVVISEPESRSAIAFNKIVERIIRTVEKK